MTIRQMMPQIQPDSFAWCDLILELSDEDFKDFLTWSACYIDRHSNEFETCPMEFNIFMDDYYDAVRALRKGVPEHIAASKRHTYNSLDSLLQVVDSNVYRRYVTALRAAS